MILTDERRTALQAIAKAAEQLAEQCEQRKAPEMGSGRCFIAGKACCAFGHVLQSALPDIRIEGNVLGNGRGLSEALGLFGHFDLPDGFEFMAERISDANDDLTLEGKTHEERQALLVNPLRAFAKFIWDYIDSGGELPTEYILDLMDEAGF